MRNRSFMDSRVSVFVCALLVFLGCFPGSILSAVVTLKSVKLYAASHTWTAKHPKVYFQCTGEKKIFFPDVVKAGELYSFKGEESWQPVTELQTKKCKKCGIYEDLIAPDHVFDEWELCSSNFDAADHHYTVFKKDEMIATFTCNECSSLTAADPPPIKEASKTDEQKSHSVILQTTIIIVVAVLVIGVPMASYKWWQKKKRQQQQARFMRLFDEDDDWDDELGLKDMN